MFSPSGYRAKQGALGEIWPGCNGPLAATEKQRSTWNIFIFVTLL
jgi:hypothetical protein